MLICTPARLAATLPIGAAALVLAFSGTAAAQPDPAHPVGGGDALGAAADDARDRFIVTLKEGEEPLAFALEADGERPAFVYRDALNGFAAALTDAEVARVRDDPSVEAVEADQVVTASFSQSMDAAGDPWGLDRIDQIALPASRTYSYNGRGADARAFVIDTGVDDTHPEFRLPSGGSRAQRSFDVFGGDGADCHGHGTHVSGTVAGTTYGVAKLAKVRGVRVLDCQGSGTMAGVIAGIDWVHAHRGNGRAVANLSLGGGRFDALNAAVERLVAGGVFVAVAAGNSAADACNFSPASAPSAYTTAASDNADRAPVFSNFGRCVDGYAPGVGILSAVPGGGTAKAQGTSMASPHVAGIGALLKGYANFSPGFITSWIDRFAVPVISGAPPGTKNLLVHKGEL